MSSDPTPDATGFGAALAARVRPRARTLRRTVLGGGGPGTLAGRLVDFATALAVPALANVDVEPTTLGDAAHELVRPPIDPWLWGPSVAAQPAAVPSPWGPSRGTIRRAPRRGLPLTTRRRRNTIGGAGTAPGAIARRLLPDTDTAAPLDASALLDSERRRRGVGAGAGSRSASSSAAPAGDSPSSLPPDLVALKRMLARSGFIQPDSVPGAERGRVLADSAPRPPWAPIEPAASPARNRPAPQRGDRSSAGTDPRPPERRIDRDANALRHAEGSPDAIGGVGARSAASVPDVAVSGGAGSPDRRPGAARSSVARPGGQPGDLPAGDRVVSRRVAAGGDVLRPTARRPVGTVDPGAPLGRVDMTAVRRVFDDRAVTSAADAVVRFRNEFVGAALVDDALRDHTLPDHTLPDHAAAGGVATVAPPASATRGAPMVPDDQQAAPPRATPSPASTASPRLPSARPAGGVTENAGFVVRRLGEVGQRPDTDSLAVQLARHQRASGGDTLPTAVVRDRDPVAGTTMPGRHGDDPGTAAVDRPGGVPPVAQRDGGPAAAMSSVGAGSVMPGRADGVSGGAGGDEVPSVGAASLPLAARRDHDAASGRVGDVPGAAGRGGVGGRDAASGRVGDVPGAAGRGGVGGRVALDGAEALPLRARRADGLSGGAGAVVGVPSVGATSLPLVARRDRGVPDDAGGDRAGRGASVGAGVLPLVVRRDRGVPDDAGGDRAGRGASVGAGALPLVARCDRDVPAVARIGAAPQVARRHHDPAALSPDRDEGMPHVASPSNGRVTADDVRRVGAGSEHRTARRVVIQRSTAGSSNDAPVRPAVGPEQVRDGDNGAGRLTATSLRELAGHSRRSNSVRAADRGPSTVQLTRRNGDLAGDDALRVGRDIPRRTATDRAHRVPLATAPGARSTIDATSRDDASSEQPLAQRFMSELGRRRRPQARPLPAQYHAMATTIVGTDAVRVASDPVSRDALRSVGKVAATVDDVIHLDRPIGHARHDVIAHELTHIAHPSPAPRFFDDDRDSPEERRAEAVASLMRSAAPSIVRRAPAAADTPQTTPGHDNGAVSAASLAARLTGSDAGDTIRRWKTGKTPGASPPSIGSGRARSAASAAPSAPPPSTNVVAPQPEAVQNDPAPASAPEAPDLATQFDRILELLEERIMTELERRGGRLRMGF